MCFQIDITLNKSNVFWNYMKNFNYCKQSKKYWKNEYWGINDGLRDYIKQIFFIYC